MDTASPRLRAARTVSPVGAQGFATDMLNNLQPYAATRLENSFDVAVDLGLKPQATVLRRYAAEHRDD